MTNIKPLLGSQAIQVAKRAYKKIKQQPIKVARQTFDHNFLIPIWEGRRLSRTYELRNLPRLVDETGKPLLNLVGKSQLRNIRTEKQENINLFQVSNINTDKESVVIGLTSNKQPQLTGYWQHSGIGNTYDACDYMTTQKEDGVPFSEYKGMGEVIHRVRFEQGLQKDGGANTLIPSDQAKEFHKAHGFRDTGKEYYDFPIMERREGLGATEGYQFIKGKLTYTGNNPDLNPDPEVNPNFHKLQKQD
ncbi:MAG: hypothetical protein ACKO37_09450, partial [Vampirovibrionales bacterium]